MSILELLELMNTKLKQGEDVQFYIISRTNETEHMSWWTRFGRYKINKYTKYNYDKNEYETYQIEFVPKYERHQDEIKITLNISNDKFEVIEPSEFAYQIRSKEKCINDKSVFIMNFGLMQGERKWA